MEREWERVSGRKRVGERNENGRDGEREREGKRKERTLGKRELEKDSERVIDERIILRGMEEK